MTTWARLDSERLSAPRNLSTCWSDDRGLLGCVRRRQVVHLE